MTAAEFEEVLRAAEAIHRRLASSFSPRRREELRQGLGAFKAVVGAGGMPYLRVEVGVLDRARRRPVVLRTTDLSYCDDDELLITSREATPRRFLVGGSDVTVPEGHCPRCLNDWAIDNRHPAACPSCGLRLPEDAVIVAAAGACPFCEEVRDPQAAGPCGCGFDWGAAFVVWR
jgi:hypothetical protein